MCAVCSGSQKPLGGLGDGEEARTEAPAELLPAVGVEVGVALEGLVVELGPDLPGEIDPELDDGARHLRMELRAPGRLAEAVALEARAAPGEWDGAGGKGELVVVPLKRRKPLGERAEDGVALGLGEPLELVPADLRLGYAAHLRAERLGEELAAEADAENGYARVDVRTDEVVLVAEPGVAVLLVGVHRAAEDHDCA